MHVPEYESDLEVYTHFDPVVTELEDLHALNITQIMILQLAYNQQE